MKNETINFILMCVAYFAIGMILLSNYTHDRTLKLTQDSVDTLIKIEVITEQQFNLLQDRIEALEKNGSRRIAVTR